MEYLVGRMFRHHYMMLSVATDGVKNKHGLNPISMAPKTLFGLGETQPPEATNNFLKICSTLSRTSGNRDLIVSTRLLEPLGPA